MILKGVFGEEEGWWFGWGPLRYGPSPWDPLLISPLGGGGEWLAGEGTRCCGRGFCGGLMLWVEWCALFFIWVPASGEAGMT